MRLVLLQGQFMQFDYNGADADFVVLFDADYQSPFALDFLCTVLLGRTRAMLIASGNNHGHSLQKLREGLRMRNQEVAAMLCEIEAPTKPEAADAIIIAALIAALDSPGVQGIVFVTHDRKLYEMGVRLIEMDGGARATAFKMPMIKNEDLCEPDTQDEAVASDGPSEYAIAAVKAWRLDHPKNSGAMPATAITSLCNKTQIPYPELIRADELLRNAV
jgi:hypothetical protein